MSKIEASRIRNLAIAGHSRAGKTTLVESILFTTGAINRMGKVEEGTTTTDYEPEEAAKTISISSALAFAEADGHRLNLIDTPGFINFLEDTHGSMKAADAAVIFISAISGIKGETEKVWGFATEFNIPVMCYVNKLDKEGSDFDNALASIRNAFGIEPVVVTMPLGVNENFNGVIDLTTMKAYTYADGKATEGDIPAGLRDAAEAHRSALVERVAESDDALLEKYLEGGGLADEEVARALRTGAMQRKLIPVVCGAPNTCIGTDRLINAVISILPSPGDMDAINPLKGTNPRDGGEAERKATADSPFSAFVFKTIADPYAGKLSLFRVCSGTLGADSNIYNTNTDAKERIGQIFYMQGKKHEPAQALGPGEIAMVAKLKNTNTGDTLSDEAQQIKYAPVTLAEPLISYAISARTKGDEDKVATGLHRILEEDPSLRFHREEEAQEMILSGMGQVHLETTLEKLKRKFGVEVEMHSPKIPYRETIKAAAKAQGRYKKQSGGKGQFGDCWIEIEPTPRGEGYEFVDKIVGGSIPRGFIPAVDKGIQEAMKRGVYAGFQMVDVRVTVFDGSYHSVDSSEMAFKIAGSMALKKALETARPIVLEPVMQVEITTPDEYLGTVIGDLNSRRGKVQGMDQIAGSSNQKVSALVPMSEMLTYANTLHSMTAGRGIYQMSFSTYEELPAHMTQKLIDENKKEDAE